MKDPGCGSFLYIAFSSSATARTPWLDVNDLLDTANETLLSSQDLLQSAAERIRGISTVAEHKDIWIHLKRRAKMPNGYRYKWKSRARVDSTTIIRMAAPITPDNNTFRTTLVYFLNAKLSSRYVEILRAHLEHLSCADVGKDSMFTLRVVLIGTQEDEDLVRELVRMILPELFSMSFHANRFQVNRLESSVFEYPGIRSVWEESQSHNSHDGLVVYAHCKGVSHIDETNSRNSEEVCASSLVLGRLYANLDILNTFPFLNRLGCVSGGGGWMWFNFWIGRSDYLSKLEKPVLTSRRHYYEDWLCRREKPSETTDLHCVAQGNEKSFDTYHLDLSSCFSILAPKGKTNIGQAYDAQTAIRLSSKYLKNQ